MFGLGYTSGRTMTNSLIALVLALAPEAEASPRLPDLVPGNGVEPVVSRIESEIEAARVEGLFDLPPIQEEIPPTEPVILAEDVGEATFYGGRFHGRRTASGERFDQHAMTAAHRTWPFGTIVRVTNMNNGRQVVVRINDRGPYGRAKKAARKVIDVSRAAAESLGFIRDGRIVARVEVLEWGD